MIKNYLEQLKIQRWDDHRYYHHSRINQSLHFVSAASFLFATRCCFSIRSCRRSSAGWFR